MNKVLVEYVKVELKNATIKGKIVRFEGVNAYIRTANNEEFKFHVEDLIPMVGYEFVYFEGKTLLRKVKKTKDGYRIIKHKNEEWLLDRYNNAQNPMTSNVASFLWSLQDFVNCRMHHLDKYSFATVQAVKATLGNLKANYKKYDEFLSTYYEVDYSELGYWIDHAEDTIYKYKKQNA